MLGFILQPTYRIERDRPVVHLFGRLEDGRSFLVRDDRQVPHFWIRAADADRAAALGATLRDEQPPRHALSGEPTVRVDVTRPGDAPALRDRLIAEGVTCYEADVRFAYRYLIERGIRGAIEIDGDSRPGHRRSVDLVFENPLVRPAHWAPRLRVLSIDIETDPRARRVLSIALAGCGAAEVLLLTPPGTECPPGAHACGDERWLLEAFVRRVHEIDPDVLTGWNVVDFDLAVLARVAEEHGVPLPLGRGPETMHLRSSNAPWATHDARLPGRLVMDGIDLLRGAFVRLEDYSLDGASRALLGRGKTITGGNRASEILHAFHHDRAHLVAYNLNDAQLVLEILDHLHLMELSVQRSLLTGLPPDRVAASISAFDFLYLSALSPRRVVAPTVDTSVSVGPAAGGHVLEPEPGLYRNVLILDFKSLYPSIIRTFQIDPLGHVPHPADDDDPIVAPNGAAFRRGPGILPGLLDELVPKRQAAKAAGDEVADYAIKILMNSFYGVLGTTACRFASPALANAITGFGKAILLWTKARIEDGGLRVLYGDTDSLFVLSGCDDPGDARALGAELAADVNDEIARHVAETWRVDSRLELEFEKLYLRLVLPAVRTGTAGARKRYAGLLDTAGGDPEVEFTGMEAVRSDWTELARQVQRDLYERLFADRPVEDYLRRIVAELRAGDHDGRLVYRKALRRKLDSYTSTTPPHVAAARKLTTRPGRSIRYVITRDGPEPVAEQRSPLDHEHYVRKQVKPVAEPVLALLGLDFDELVGDGQQMRLF